MDHAAWSVKKNLLFFLAKTIGMIFCLISNICDFQVQFESKTKPKYFILCTFSSKDPFNCKFRYESDAYAITASSAESFIFPNNLRLKTSYKNIKKQRFQYRHLRYAKLYIQNIAFIILEFYKLFLNRYDFIKSIDLIHNP